MSLLAKDSGSVDYKPIPEGTHVARCIRVVDLGTQISFEKALHRIMLTWELPFELIKNKEGVEMPMLISRDYTLSLHEMSTLRPELESWRGKAFTAEELDGFEMKKLLGAPCQVAVAHKPSKKNGRIYPNVTAVVKLAKGMTCPDAAHELLYYEVTNGKDEVFQKLPSWVQDKIIASVEMQKGHDENGYEPTSDPASSQYVADADLPF